MRVLVNIAHGYNLNANEVLPDRCSFYTEMLDDLLEQLRSFQIELDFRD